MAVCVVVSAGLFAQGTDSEKTQKIAAAGQSAMETPDQGGYYRSPMDIRLLPSANFAETRPGHLHAGVDIKTGGVEGKKLYVLPTVTYHA